MAQLQEAVTSKAAQPRDGSAAKAGGTRTLEGDGLQDGAASQGLGRRGPKKVQAKQQAGRAAAKIARPMAIRINNQDGQVQQMMMQVRPILRAEFHVIRVACRPTPEQRKTIARAAEQMLRDATKKYVESMRRPMNVAQRVANDPRKLIEDGMVQALKSQLSAEQVARYEEELTKRAAGRKRLALRNLVARLDHDLVLSPEQRDKLSESLSAHWDDSWGQSLEMFMYDNNALPPISDQYVTPILNESQKRIWRSTQRYQTFWGGFGVIGGIMDNDPLEDEELREARLAAEAKAAKEPQALQQMEMMKGQMMEMMKVQKRVLEKVQRKK